MNRYRRLQTRLRRHISILVIHLPPPPTLVQPMGQGSISDSCSLDNDGPKAKEGMGIKQEPRDRATSTGRMNSLCYQHTNISRDMGMDGVTLKQVIYHPRGDPGYCYSTRDQEEREGGGGESENTC